MSAISTRALLASDWTKIRTIRSTMWTLSLTFVLGVGLSYLIGVSFRSRFPDMPRHQQETFDPLFATFYSITLAQLALVIFGVLVVSSEYSSGTIRASLLAVPRRGLFYGCKMLAAILPAIAVSLVTVLVTFATAQVALGRYRTSWGTNGVPRTIVGAVVYLTLICLFAMGVAMMLRSSTRSLAILLPLFFLGSQGLGNVPKLKTVTQYLPDQAGSVIMHIVGPPENPVIARDYGAWTGIGIMALWTAAALTGGYLVLRHRDA
jgi:ABC-type transport system involved in multi-copper enzyme maturation permease subunit